MKIGMIIYTNLHLTDLGSLCIELKKENIQVLFFANANVNYKPHYNPFLHPEHMEMVPHDEILWYTSDEDLKQKIEESDVEAVFTEESLPFVFNPAAYKDRKFKILSIVHSVDNFHLRAVANGTVDKTFAPYEKYGEYLGWDKKDYVALGLPKYDLIQSLDKAKIQKKYTLPEKYILLLTPNNGLLSFIVLLNIIVQIKKSGYEVILKGKYPKCHKWIYRFLGKKYFLSEDSFFPFVTHELIFASSGVVGFDTTAVEEILMCERPLVNFSIKPYREKAALEGNFKQFVPMWNAPYCLDLDLKEHNGFNIFKSIPQFTSHFAKKFDYTRIQKEVFTVPGGASERIVAWVKDFLRKN